MKITLKSDRLKEKTHKSNYKYSKQLRDNHEDVKYDIKNCGWVGKKSVDLLECVWT